MIDTNDNYYNILEIEETATPNEIKKAYRGLSLKFHPDRNQNNPDACSKFQKINEAYETLSDIEKKNEYDMNRKNPFFKMMNGNSRDTTVDDFFSNLFGMHGMQFNHRNEGMPFGHGMGMGMGMPFGPGIHVFHNGNPVHIHQSFSQGLQKPPPIITHITIPIKTALLGNNMSIEIERWRVENGHKIFEKEIVHIIIPKGIDEGEIIVLRDKGNVINETVKGDIKFFINIENNSEFKRSGIDLIFEKKITLKEALCGFSFELKHLNERTYTINNNIGTIIPSGFKKIIPNMGMTKEGITGNLLIIFDVEFPTKLSETVLESLKMIDF